jgi:hypothetical protein
MTEKEQPFTLTLTLRNLGQDAVEARASFTGAGSDYEAMRLLISSKVVFNHVVEGKGWDKEPYRSVLRELEEELSIIERGSLS